MGSLSPETQIISSDVYHSLGLSKPHKRISEAPPVLFVLSYFLQRAVHRDEKLLEAMNKKEPITVFHGLRAPSLSIEQYMERIFKYANCSPSCFVLAHIYIDRFLQQPGTHLTSLNVHRLLITSVMVAAKFIDDAFFNNAYYARVGGVSTYEINRLEMKFLFSLDFRLQVTVETFSQYCLQLQKEEIVSSCQIERPIQLCGLTNNKDVEVQHSFQRFNCGAV